MNSIKHLLHATLLTSKKSVSQLADETAISASYLYRACNPEDESNVRFPLDYFVPLMKATNNYSVLKHIANLCGFVLTLLPKLKVNKKEKNQFVSDYQEATVNATKKLIDYFNDSNETNYKEWSVAVQQVLEKSVAAQHLIEMDRTGQMELYL
jgi:Tfp pilus tip-associated adhesin PilY1